MDLGIKGKRALVLGASGGLGGAVALGLLAEGAVVHAAGRNIEKLEQIRAGLSAAGADYRPVALDLTDRAGLEALADRLIGEGGIDILVNNSGGPAPGGVQAQSPDAWEAAFSAMASSLFHLTNLLLPQMIEKGWGRIITIGSSGVEAPIANLALSNGVRAAVLGWSKTLAGEVANKGVTVNMVLPGRIATERVAQLDALGAQRQGTDVETVRASSIRTIPAGRYGAPEEFAALCTFLASAQASYVTGSKIRVDGGMLRGV